MQKSKTLLTPQISDLIPPRFESWVSLGVFFCWGGREKKHAAPLLLGRTKEFCMLAASVDHFQEGAFTQLPWS